MTLEIIGSNGEKLDPIITMRWLCSIHSYLSEFGLLTIELHMSATEQPENKVYFF